MPTSLLRLLGRAAQWKRFPCWVRRWGSMPGCWSAERRRVSASLRLHLATHVLRHAGVCQHGGRHCQTPQMHAGVPVEWEGLVWLAQMGGVTQSTRRVRAGEA